MTFDRLGGDVLLQILGKNKTVRFFPEKINLFERKDLEDKPKDYLLGLDGRLQEGLRKKRGLAICAL